jgi:putative SOS response-associated peptidase YedK
MCGRVRLSSGYSEIKIRLKVASSSVAPNFEPDWNKPPTAPMLVAIRSVNGERVPKMMKWGLIPHWAKDELHNRMPVILAEINWPKWLGEEPASEQDLLALLKPCRDEDLRIWPVDKMVGNVRNNGPQLVLPVLSNAVPA